MLEDKKLKFLDLKIPLGCLLTFYGIVLTLYGIFTDPTFYVKSLNIDINLRWGIVMLVIGVVLIIASYNTYAKNKKHTSMDKK